jgi:cell division protein FtsB
MDGKTTNIKAWNKEIEQLSAEKGRLYQNFNQLKDDVHKIEAVQRCVEDIIAKSVEPQKMEKLAKQIKGLER